MPPSHTASRAVLTLLVVALAAGFSLLAVEPASWQQGQEQFQQWWSALRQLIEGSDGSSALGRR